MFTIQYEAVDGTHKLQTFDAASRTKLLAHLARFDRPIMAVYERHTPITKAVQVELQGRKDLLKHAREFMNQPSP